MIAGARLKESGIDSVRIVDKAGDFGGTWYWNRYPGAQCDTASFVYMPLLEETGHVPTEKYAHAPEILEHSRRIGKQFGLYDDALFHTEVTDLEWDAQRSAWIVRTNRGDEFTAQYLAMGTGPLHVPKLPGVEGIDDFQGHSFHTSRWDYTYTGGDESGAPMTELSDKRVGLIGTGATAVQCVPHLAKACRELYVFQRTPSSVDVRANRPTDMEWFEREVHVARKSAESGTANPVQSADFAKNFSRPSFGKLRGRVHALGHEELVRCQRSRRGRLDSGQTQRQPEDVLRAQEGSLLARSR